jgi:carboxyl-terminal processing protease
MSNNMKKVKFINRKLLVIGFILIAIIVAYASTNVYKDISNSMRIYNEVFRQLFTNYVDPIKIDEFTEASVHEMMKELDPYTVFMNEEEQEPLETLTRGSYGGVGLRISMRKDTLTVIAPMEGSPAYRANILPGDQILKVDSISTVGMEIDKAAQRIRGEVGTKVVLTIQRPGAAGLNEYTLTRENISVKDVSYSGILSNDVGYVRLSGFSKGASNEVKQAITQLLNDDPQLQALILDLRGNPGGLLTEALALSELFTDAGDTLLLTRGRAQAANKVYVSRMKPFLSPDIKLAVLINQGSASASEIVAGIIQDLDRGIVIGSGSFGKGLVQTVFKIDNQHSVKITTAKYFIPSGRLIQKPDYLNNPELVEQSAPVDTLFYSKNQRKLKGGGGITPDITVDAEKLTDYARELWRQNMFYSYAIKYKSEHGQIPLPVVVDERMIEDFRVFLQQDCFLYYLKNEKQLRDLEKDLLQDEHFKNLKNPFQTFYTTFDSLKASGFDQNLARIKRGLKSELSTLAGGLAERVKADLDEDPVVLKAISVLQDKIAYNTTLGYAF